MLRNFVALTVLAVVGALLLPNTSWAGPTGLRAGGMRAGGYRAPFIIHRNARAGILRHARRGGPMLRINHAAARPIGRAGSHARIPSHVRIPPGTRGAFTTSRLMRLHHRKYINGWIYPITTASGASFIGTPYDPAEAIPVYAPQPAAEEMDAALPRRAPQLSSARDDNPDACRSERVTVPAAEGEREITVVRC